MTFSIGLVSTIGRKQLAFPPTSSKGVGLEVRVGPRCWKTKGKTSTESFICDFHAWIIEMKEYH